MKHELTELFDRINNYIQVFESNGYLVLNENNGKRLFQYNAICTSISPSNIKPVTS
jgi:hypothetical protein